VSGLPLYCEATAGARAGVLHRPDLDSGPDGEADGRTVCGLWMMLAEGWAAAAWRPGRACGVCCWDASATALSEREAEELEEALG
jgi:hypothetical protein